MYFAPCFPASMNGEGIKRLDKFRKKIYIGHDYYNNPFFCIVLACFHRVHYLFLPTNMNSNGDSLVLLLSQKKKRKPYTYYLDAKALLERSNLIRLGLSIDTIRPKKRESIGWRIWKIQIDWMTIFKKMYRMDDHWMILLKILKIYRESIKSSDNKYFF